MGSGGSWSIMIINSLVIIEELSLCELAQAMAILIFIRERISSNLSQDAGFPS
jgi:hypothetical protein